MYQHLVILCREDALAHISRAPLNSYHSDRCFQDHCTEVVFQMCVCFTVRHVFIHCCAYRRSNYFSTNFLFFFLCLSNLTLTKSNLSILQKKKPQYPSKAFYRALLYSIHIYRYVLFKYMYKEGWKCGENNSALFWISQIGRRHDVRTIIS